MPRSNNKKSGTNTARRSPVREEPVQDENVYSKLLEKSEKRNEMLKLRKDAKNGKKGNGVAAGTIPSSTERSASRARTSETITSSMAGFPDMLRGFFSEKNITGMSTEMKADGTMTHSFHFKPPGSKVKVMDGDDEDDDLDSDGEPSDSSEDGLPPNKMPRFSCRTGTSSPYMHSRRTIKIEGGSPDDRSLGEFLSQLSSMLKDGGTATSGNFRVSCSGKVPEKSPAPTPAPSTPVKKPAPKTEPSKTTRDVSVATLISRKDAPRERPELSTRSIQTDQMDCTTTCSKCARTSEHCSKAQREAEEAQSMAKKYEEKAGRTDVAEKRCKELQKEAKKAAEEKEKREKEVKKMEKNHANELKKKDREMEAFKSTNESTAEKVANYQEAIKKANAKSATLEKQVESLKEEMKQIQTCMDSYAEVEVWLKTEKLKNLQLEEELAELKRQERKTSSSAWGNPEAAKKDAEEIRDLKKQLNEHIKNDRAQAQVNSDLAQKLLESEKRYREICEEKVRDNEVLDQKNKKIGELMEKAFNFETEVINLKRDFQIRESENKVIGMEKNKIEELKQENSDLKIHVHQQKNTINVLIQQIAKPHPPHLDSHTSGITNGLASLSMHTDLPQPPSRSTWSTLSTASDSPPATAYIPTPIQRPKKKQQQPQQQEQPISNIPGWMKTLAPIGTKPAAPAQEAAEPTPEWMSAVIKNSDPDGDWMGAVLPEDDDLDVAPVNSLVQSFGGFPPLIPLRMEENKCFVCLWDIKKEQTTLECGLCQRKVHEQCGRKLVDSGEPCWGCEQQKKGYHNGIKA